MSQRFAVRRKIPAFALGLIAALWAVSNLPVSAYAAPVIANGTVMVGTGNGKVSMYSQTGTLLGQLDTTTASTEESGSVFDASGNFLTTDFEANTVTKFDPTGALIGAFGSGYNADPESIIFDASGNAYVGQADGSHQVLKFDSAGNLLTTFSPAVDTRGTDWIELGSDNCTLFYTSEGTLVKRFDVCNNVQLADFNTSPLPNTAYAHSILLPFQFGGGGMLIADTSAVIRLDASGNQVQTYTLPNATFLFAMALDPDGTSFWTADQVTGEVFKVDIQTGNVLQDWLSSGAPGFNDVAGLSIKGELIAALPPPDCSNVAASKPTLWPPNHKFVPETVLGVTAVDGPVTIGINSIFQDEATNAKGSGHTCPDGKGIGTTTAQVRAERSGTSDGRVYHIDFTATDQAGQTCTSEVTVCVPHNKGNGNGNGHGHGHGHGNGKGNGNGNNHGGAGCIDEGALYDSTVCP